MYGVAASWFLSQTCESAVTAYVGSPALPACRLYSITKQQKRRVGLFQEDFSRSGFSLAKARSVRRLRKRKEVYM